MELPALFVIITASLFYRVLFAKRYIDWFVLGGSIICLFYFQPISSIRALDFWLPMLSLSIGILAWEIVVNPEIKKEKSTRITFFIFFGLMMIFGLIRFIPKINISSLISIPGPIAIVSFAISYFLTILALRRIRKSPNIAILLVMALIAIFLIIKNEFLSLQLSVLLRQLNDQSIALAQGNEIIWVGYSYFAFRLIHVLVDARKHGFVEVELPRFLGYLFFFPALLAGPIMRIADYSKAILEERNELRTDVYSAFERIATGLFQKFILADLLAIISINQQLAAHVNTTGWMWFFVLMFTFRIYFDFSGYSHIAIGTAYLLGIRLPENFDHPLRSPTVTIFWNKWHVTLTQWFRTYYFNPFTRFLKKNFSAINQNLIMGFMQISTMVLIGLWHGISWNFVLWGLWIGLGLFVQNTVTNRYMKNNSDGKPFWQVSRFAKAVSTVATFLYISVGWVWFAMPDVSSSIHIFRTMMGMQ